MTKLARSTQTGTRWLIAAGSLVIVGGLLAACSASPQAAPSSAPSIQVARPDAPQGTLPADLQAKLQEAVDDTLAEYSVPATAVGVWIPGQGSWETAAGLADIANNIPASTDMSWPLRSITKSYTVTLILQLVDEGKVSLDDTISQYVDGVTDGDKITLRELANMSSGNADYTNADFGAAFEQDPTKIFTIDELNSFMLGKPAQFAPGTEKVYTNANTNLLGAVVEKVTGEDFATALDERILTPLAQSQTEYLVDVDRWTAPHPVGYQPGPDGPVAQTQNLSILGAAGSMFSTLDDTRVWAETLATGALLQPATQEEREIGAPLESGPPYDLYALGIGETDGWWGHNGEGIGFTAAAFHNPETGASIVVFMNESNVFVNESEDEGKAHPADQLFRRIAEILKTT
ncbi:serine hydrolase domain-containing protein [Microbacterium rhizomatis]|nr:serine hydrolase domain-containing protein [Microbacterium rhizomatis]